MGLWDALGGAASGAAMGSAIPGLGTIIGGGLGLLSGIFGSKKKKVEQQTPQPLQSPEQTALQNKLSTYLMGKIGTPKAQYGGSSVSQFTPTQYEVMNKLRAKMGMAPVAMPNVSQNQFGMYNYPGFRGAQGMGQQMPQEMGGGMPQGGQMGGGGQQIPPGLMGMMAGRMGGQMGGGGYMPQRRQMPPMA